MSSKKKTLMENFKIVDAQFHVFDEHDYNIGKIYWEPTRREPAHWSFIFSHHEEMQTPDILTSCSKFFSFIREKYSSVEMIFNSSPNLSYQCGEDLYQCLIHSFEIVSDDGHSFVFHKNFEINEWVLTDAPCNLKKEHLSALVEIFEKLKSLEEPTLLNLEGRYE